MPIVADHRRSLYSEFIQEVIRFIETRQESSNVKDIDTLTLFREAILNQNQPAWREIWRLYQPSITRKIRREMAGWNCSAEEIKDLTQTVFIKFWQDTSQWKNVDMLYTEQKQEGVLSRLHSTTVFTVQRYRQSAIRCWIPIIRSNYPLCSSSNHLELQSIANTGLSTKYRDLFILHLKGCKNQFISNLMNLELRNVSIQINRAWERYVYVLLSHRRQNPEFENLFQFLITEPQGERI